MFFRGDSIKKLQQQGGGVAEHVLLVCLDVRVVVTGSCRPAASYSVFFFVQWCVTKYSGRCCSDTIGDTLYNMLLYSLLFFLVFFRTTPLPCPLRSTHYRSTDIR